MIMRQIVPGVPARAVILADCSPLSFAEVGPPQIPVAGLPQAVLEPAEPLHPFLLRVHHGSLLPRPGAGHG
ncbi:MAG: hypothetical protein QOE41_1287, partial [Mycobacterium sp.]|nr:hypothetical protein [Mycobacterium sp.]